MNKVMMHQSSRMRDEFDAWAKCLGMRTDLVAQIPGQADHMKPYNSTKTGGAWLAWQQLYPLVPSSEPKAVSASADMTDKEIDDIYNLIDWPSYPQIAESKSIREMDQHRRRAFARAVIAKTKESK